MKEQLDGQVGWFAQDTWSGKTCQEPSAAETRKEQTLQPSSRKLSKSQNREPLCLCVSRTEDGQNPGAITLKMAPGALLGEYTTRSFGESPREENASRLSAILEDCPLNSFGICNLAQDETHCDCIGDSRPSWCPIAQLPEGHGRLGDLDRLFEVIGQDADRWIVDEVSMIETDDVLDAIQNAPTIVPAEGGGENG